MKTIFGKVSVSLCLAAAFGLLTLKSRAIEIDPASRTDLKTDASAVKPDAQHGSKIVHRTESGAGHLTTLLTGHTKKVADRAEAATVHVARRFEEAGHKAGDLVKKVTDKLGKKG